LNPVRAGLVKKAEDYRWSSTRAHLTGSDDGVVTVKPMLDRVSIEGARLSYFDIEKEWDE
jgi:putative transposase